MQHYPRPPQRPQAYRIMPAEQPPAVQRPMSVKLVLAQVFGRQQPGPMLASK